MMEWTKDKPSEPGWYWWKGIHDYNDDPIVVNVEINPINKQLYVGTYRKPMKEWADELQGEWSSTPIPTPGGER